MTPRVTRRSFIVNTSALGAAHLLAFPRPARAEPPPETTKISLFEGPVTCIAPHYVAQELLLQEGFSEVRYVKFPSETQSVPPENLLSGEVDMSLSFVPTDIAYIDSGAPIVILAGSHIGCVELFGANRVKSTVDLKGRTISVSRFGGDDHVFISMFAAYVGLNPQKDINWVIHPDNDRPRLFTEGKIDAFFIGPPWSIEQREKKLGHVLVNTTTDKPWSNYFCCLVATSREFVSKYPVATKRALRAILKAGDVCASDPSRVARLIADKGLARYENTLQMLQELSYRSWREYDPADAVRFFALRMREVGIIKSGPEQIVARGTDWRFLNQLKKELKA
jgi:NitT/TauT family transport system substrate-binding protein